MWEYACAIYHKIDALFLHISFSETPKFRIDDKFYPIKLPLENNELRDALLQYCKEVLFIIHTAIREEMRAVNYYMEPPTISEIKQEKTVKLKLCKGFKAILGTFGGYKVALLCEQDSYPRNQPEDTEDFIDILNNFFPKAKCVIALGIGYAFRKRNIQLGDVLVSKFIDGICKVMEPDENNSISFCREATRFTPMSKDLIHIFTTDISNPFECTEQNRKSKIHKGTILSVSDDVMFKISMKLITWRSNYLIVKEDIEHLFDGKPAYIGGDSGFACMGLKLLMIKNKLITQPRNLDVILIKGVASYANDSSCTDNTWKRTAALSAAHYAKHILERQDHHCKQYFSG